MAEETPEAATPKRPKKLTKDLAAKPGTVIITVSDGVKGAQEYIFNQLPDKIRKLFGPFGLGHKLGDAAAGRAGKDAESAITKVWEGLMKGDWSVRAPAAPKISVAEVKAKFDRLSPAEQKTAKKLLEGLGITISGME